MALGRASASHAGRSRRRLCAASGASFIGHKAAALRFFANPDGRFTNNQTERDGR
jgi:hypothetical protein